MEMVMRLKMEMVMRLKMEVMMDVVIQVKEMLEIVMMKTDLVGGGELMVAVGGWEARQVEIVM